MGDDWSPPRHNSTHDGVLKAEFEGRVVQMMRAVVAQQAAGTLSPHATVMVG